MAIALLTLALVGTLSLLAIDRASATACRSARAGDEDRTSWRRSDRRRCCVMAHSFIMFFLIATGVEMKEMEKAHGWGDSFRRRTIAMKGRVFPIA